MDWLTSSYSKLPSQVEKTLAPCPKFRIVLVGKTGVGKSSLVSAVFNVVFNVDLPGGSHSDSPIDIAHDRAGKADINREFYSDQNPRFILHDSMGFEPGSTEKSEIVKAFLKKRGSKTKLQDQVHAIWLCIETPREGSRLQQTGDEELLKLADELKIPVIVVFTKYDLLIAQHIRTFNHIESPSEKVAEAKKLTEETLQKVGKDLKVPFVAVSTDKKFKDEKTRLLVELTDVTREQLRKSDIAGSLWVAWATAQQINAREKVDLSISEGSKKYWRNLGESAVFSGHSLGQCISRIHEDVLKVWNFNDPLKVLSGEKFMTGMLELVEPLRDDKVIKNQSQGDRVGMLANVASIINVFGSNLVIPALVTIMGTMAFNFLRSKYKKSVSTGRYLAAYIVDLILVLHELSITVMADPPKSLSDELVMDALELYKARSAAIHAKVAKIIFTPDVERSISGVISETLKLDK